MPTEREERKLHNINKEKYTEAYEWCQETISDNTILPKLKANQIIEYVSQQNWLLFPLEIETSKEDAKDESRPNIYLSILGKSFQMGLTLNQIKAVEWFKNIIESHSEDKKEKLLEKLHQLPEKFQTELNRKIKDKYHLQAPDYKNEFTLPSNQINSQEFEKIIKKADIIRDEGTIKRIQQNGKYYSELPEINLATIKLDYNKINMTTAAKHLFPILKLCLSIETLEENQASILYKELLEDHLLRQFKNNKQEYYEQFVQKKYPNITIGKFRNLFNTAIKESDQTKK